LHRTPKTLKFVNMKKILLQSLLFIGLTAGTLMAQSTIPAINVKDIKGQTFNTGNIDNGGKPMIVSFWATWCKPCILELNTIQEQYPDLVKETGVKLIAISIDDARNSAKVAPYVQMKEWEYDVYIDENGDFKRAMNVNNVPHTFLINANKEIVWSHNSYSPGDEEELYELVRKLAKDGTIDGAAGSHQN
jgi:cytochrome c biogenesis protein CcmG, thiol:disulfide interchange protein DsbE